MSPEPQIVVYGQPNTIESTGFDFPVCHKTFSNLDLLKNHVVQHSGQYTFIALLTDLNDQNSHSVVEDFKSQGLLFFAIFICRSPSCRFTFNDNNVFPVARQFIKTKISRSVIRFFESQAEIHLQANRLDTAHALQQQANDLKVQLRSITSRIKACHVLIIPLNTTDDNLYDFQERVIELCNDLCGDYEPTVLTLYDYISADMCRHLDEIEYADQLMNFVKTVSLIRLYLVGNEIHIENYAGQYFYRHETYATDAVDYDEKLIVVENEPIGESIRLRLGNIIGDTRQAPADILPIRLDDIREDIRFAGALERAHVTLPGREMVGDFELYRQTMEHVNNSIGYSGAFHIIAQATNDPNNQIDHDNQAINNSIQFDSIRIRY